MQALCENSGVLVHTVKSVHETRPSPERVMEILREKCDKQTAYRLNDFSLDATGAVVWSDHSNPVRFSARSLRRMCAVVGIPFRVLCEESARSRRAAARIIDIINDRLSDMDDGFTAIIYDNVVEGVLSPHYKRLPNVDATDFLFSRLKMDESEVVDLRLEETRMILNVASRGSDILPAQKALLKIGDPIRYGTTMTNSEDADASVVLGLFLERLRCLNGATVIDPASGSSAIHHTGQHFYTRFSVALDAVHRGVDSLFGDFGDMRRTAISGEEFAGLQAMMVDAFSEKRASRILDDAAANTTETPDGPTQTTKADALRSTDGRLISVYNLWNGVTFQGHDVANLNQQRAVQMFGGVFLRTWRDHVSVN